MKNNEILLFRSSLGRAVVVILIVWCFHTSFYLIGLSRGWPSAKSCALYSVARQDALWSHLSLPEAWSQNVRMRVYATTVNNELLILKSYIYTSTVMFEFSSNYEAPGAIARPGKTVFLSRLERYCYYPKARNTNWPLVICEIKTMVHGLTK